MLQREGSNSKGLFLPIPQAQNPQPAAAQALIVILPGRSGAQTAAVSHREIRQQGSRTEGKEESGLPSA